MWTYNSSNGTLSRDGKLAGKGYSGHGDAVNDPARENEVNVGPIPRGHWKMTGWIEKDPHLGLGVIVLAPADGTDTHGRAGFRWHGDNGAHIQTASHGCIVQGNLSSRRAAWESGDHELEVV